MGVWCLPIVGYMVFSMTNMELPEMEAKLGKMEVEVGLFEDLVIFNLVIFQLSF